MFRKAQRLVQRALNFALHVDVFGGTCERGELVDIVHACQFASAVLLTSRSPDLIGRDRVDPGEAVPSTVVVGDASGNFDEGLLSYVFRLRALADQAGCERQQYRPQLVHQDVERGPVPVCQADKCLIGRRSAGRVHLPGIVPRPPAGDQHLLCALGATCGNVTSSGLDVRRSQIPVCCLEGSVQAGY